MFKWIKSLFVKKSKGAIDLMTNPPAYDLTLESKKFIESERQKEIILEVGKKIKLKIKYGEFKIQLAQFELFNNKIDIDKMRFIPWSTRELSLVNYKEVKFVTTYFKNLGFKVVCKRDKSYSGRSVNNAVPISVVYLSWDK